MFDPVIKWTGSKRNQAKLIIEKFPKTIDTYYEPFCGGCSVLRQLLESDIEAKRFVCSDANHDLIDLWDEIKNNPKSVSEYYKNIWLQLTSLETWKDKRDFYFSVRKRFNANKNPLDFMFIMRTAVNGLPRYNQKGEFNTSFHINRNGINPKTLARIVDEWSCLLNKNNVIFNCSDYINISSCTNDVLYLDPPYAVTKGMYYGSINFEYFWNWIRQQKGKCYLSFDGKTNKSDNTFNVPKDVYQTHEYLPSGLSHYKSVVNGTSDDTFVYESLYICK